MPSNKTIFKVKCNIKNCKTSKIRSDKIHEHYKHKHPHVKPADMKFTKVAIKRDNNNWVSLNCDIPYNITNGVETQLQKKTITSYFQKKISVIEDSQIVLSPHPIPSSSEVFTLYDEQISNIEDSQIVLSSHPIHSSSEALTLHDEQISNIEDSQIVLSPHPIPGSSEALTLHEGINYEDIQSPSLIQLYKKKEPNDPFHFILFRMTNILINFIIAVGPCQPCTNKFQYPVTNKRSMNITYYRKVNIDGSLNPRNWLSYSTTLDKVFCLYCIMFGGPKSNTFWTQHGVNNWKNIKRDLERHEASSLHKDCEYANMTWLANKRIQDHLLSNKLDIIMENRNIVHNIINAIMYLIKCNIAFWGSNSNEGNFMCLIKLMAKTVPTLRAYMDNNEKLRRKKSDKISRPYINLLSYGHVKKITEIIKIKITKSIIQTIKENRAYSIILDGTYDVSKKECIALLVRYIEDDLHPHPVERIIHVFTTSETTGENIKKHVFSKFNDLGLPLDYLVGQSMDGAGNMRGVYKGMQALILKEAPKAIYIWCHAHRLNLVVAHVCGCKIEMKKAMRILDELYNFMNGVRRQGVFVKYQMRKSKKSLKRIKNTTRNWSSSYKSVEIFLDVYEHILASLVELKDSNDPSTSSIADGNIEMYT
ncbi:zinc finger MYM-type protein 1-like isoform X3 [Gordionus sp. m RMFG-2023]|uniref:zinc finger MYM-type protein 1-like isoform X3 n=1 Tax=Gordionus sp. m RMFG-2023 TaxID=3053472 RepID=UPI0031FD80D1